MSSKAELLGNHQGLAEVVSAHLANKKPEALLRGDEVIGVFTEIYWDYVTGREYDRMDI